MSASTRIPLERHGYAAMATLTLSPAVLQGLWRPLAQARQVSADSVGLTFAALGIAAVAVLACAASFGRASNRWIPAVSAVLAALVFGCLLGEGMPAIETVTVALVGVAAFAGALTPWLVRRLPEDLDSLAARNKGGATLMLVLGVFTVQATARLSVFMGDASRPDLSLAPDIPFFVKHACLTAYVQGARLATEGMANLYDNTIWPHLSELPVAKAYAVPYAPFGLDTYAYPPPFLLLPRLLLTPLPDFASQRAVWYSLNTLFAAFGLWSVATWIGGRARTRVLLLAPLVWSSLPTLGTFQVGNAQLAVVVAAMLALVAFETRRPSLGGALLSFTILAKISPGLIVVLLLLQRRYREVAWTAAWGLVFVLLGLAVFGVAPYVAFVTYELPRLSSGAGMAFLAWPESVVINDAPFGIPFKLAALRVPLADPWAIGRALNSIFTVILVGLTVLAARKRGGPRVNAEVWAAMLTLASLRSPLAPGYIVFALIWLLSMRAAEVRGRWQVAALVAMWIAVTAPLTIPGAPGLIVSMFQEAAIMGVAVYYLLKRPSPLQVSELHN